MIHVEIEWPNGSLIEAIHKYYPECKTYRIPIENNLYVLSCDVYHYDPYTTEHYLSVLHKHGKVVLTFRGSDADAVRIHKRGC